MSLLLAMLRTPLDKSWRAYYAAVAHDAATSAQQAALAITFLPHQAWVSADAILRTLWRLCVTRKQLLEWQTASQTERLISPAVMKPRSQALAVARSWRPRLVGEVRIATTGSGSS